TQLIELYTSEGCSSCPPADAWFSELAEEDGLWSDYVPVAFHVTYWNFLGWRDVFSDRRYDQRQRRRAGIADSSVYTPGVFRDGDEFRQWRRLRAAPKGSSSASAGQLSVDIENGDIVASFAAGSDQDDLALEIAVLSSGITSSVKAGENRGRSLRHDFVVVDLQSDALTNDNGVWRARLPLPATQDVSKPALAAWVVDANGQPLQATGGWLPEASDN
ncbi:MAG: DUF1223 domain-containing protein, partial [Gammaproteobacteria bacterium]